MTGVLALHGFTGSPSELGFLIERVEQAGFPVVAPLLPGHGTSPSDLQNRTFGEWLGCAREALAPMRARHGRVVVCGFSMGSLLALALASDAATRPSVDGLVLLGCALRLSPPLRAAFNLVRAVRVKLPDAYVPKPFGPDIRDKTLSRAIESYDKHPIRAANEVYRAGLRLADHLGDVTCRTLVLHGDQDRVCDVSSAREVASGLGTDDVRVRTYARSAHMLALDYDREAVAADVISFLERVDSQVWPVEP